ncbi:MAG: biotin/lipoyl-binding protein [Anaerolineae bacterium]|nr:biotin/lipoyl-binding protein [Anaerolineae bacterium]NUQ02974.1 biotin/lipoyl-binding protein [Anaerolineae bacterium]
MQKTYVYNGRTVMIDLAPLPDGRWRAQIDGREHIVTVRPLPDGGVTLTLDGERRTVYVERAGADRLAALDGIVYTLSPPEVRGGRRRGVRPGANELTAQMPGQIREVLVSEEQAVARGQTILLLEAMKMEIRAAAPADGVVTRLLVKAGDVVERGQRLAEIRPDEGTEDGA